MAALVFGSGCAVLCWEVAGTSARGAGALHAVADLRRARAVMPPLHAPGPHHPSNPKSTPRPRLDPRPSPPQIESIVARRHQILDQQLRTNPTRKKKKKKEARTEAPIARAEQPPRVGGPDDVYSVAVTRPGNEGPGAPTNRVSEARGRGVSVVPQVLAASEAFRNGAKGFHCLSPRRTSSWVRARIR